MDYQYRGRVVKTYPKRSYYSELIWANQPAYFLRSNLYAVCKKRTSEFWKTRTERYGVKNQSIVEYERPKYLAPEERWIIFNEEHGVAFPVSTFKPKVQMLDDVEPKTLPRRVEIERRRRLFMAQDLKKLLNEANVSKMELIPPEALDDFIYKEEKLDFFSKIHFLPLELFDDNEYDCRTPEDWLLQGVVDGVRYPMPGEAFLPQFDKYNEVIKANINMDGFDYNLLEDLFEWQQVSINEYDKENDLYYVVPLNQPDFTMNIPRIYLEFKAEDPQNFVCRIKNAIKERQKSENMIKYQTYLDCLILPGIQGIPEDQMERIHKIGTQNEKTLGTQMNSIARIEKEMNYLFQRTQGEFVFRRVIHINPRIFSHFIKLPPRGEQLTAKPKGCIDTDMVDFYETRRFIQWVNIYVLSETYQAMFLVVKECSSLDSKWLFNFHYGRNVTLEEFNNIQNNQIKNMCEFLCGPWKETIQRNTKMSLRDVGKGDFNMNIKEYYVFFRSKLYRMLELIKYRMEDALVFLTQRSLEFYTKLIANPCICTLETPQAFVWGSDLVYSPFHPSSPPVFLVTLKLGEDEPYYCTDPKKYEPTVISLFNMACASSHEVEWITPGIMTKLVFDPTVRLSSIGLLNPIIMALRTRLEIGLRAAIIPLKAYLVEYNQHVPFYNLDLEEYVRKFEGEDHQSIEVKEEISKQFRLRKQLKITLPNKIIIGPFIVVVEPTKTFLIDKRTELINRLLKMYSIRMRQKTDEILFDYEDLFKKLMVDPISIEHIFELRDWIETIPLVVKGLDEMMRVYMIEYEVLDYFWYVLSDEDFKAKWNGIVWPYKLRLTEKDRLLFYETESERFQKMQVENENALHERIEGLTSQVTNISQIYDIERVHEMAIEVRRMYKGMLECVEQGQLLCMRQKLFGLPVVPWENLTKLMKEFEPFRNLWITASDWLKLKEIWFENPLVNIDAENIVKTVQDFSKHINKAVRTFQDIRGMKMISEGIRRQIDEFKPLVPIIQALLNPGIKERHWEEFAVRTGIVVDYSEILTFSECIHLGVDAFEKELQEMSDGANKEYAIELTLTKMQKEWDYLNFDVQDYKETGTYIIKVVEEIELLLDDQLLMTQQISFSPFKAAFEKEIGEWEWKLKTTQLVLEQWQECQKTWMYLEPIFSSEDISSQLPIESKKFGTMERNWRRIMKMTKDCPKIMSVCPDKRLLEALRECNHLLDIVEHGLAEYLELKRMGFPRLYFLSDDELLDILAQAKYPLAVQPHLRKCFENIHHLQFEEDLQITKMFSSEGECVTLIPSMYPVGMVETWLSEVESTMRSTIRETFSKAVIEYEKVPREKWVLSWPGQIVIAGSQTFWTANVERSIANRKLSQYLKTMLNQLDILRTLVKGELSRIDREIISALIVIEVHARDVLDNLIREKVKDANDFEWIGQLRYYWITTNEKSDLKIRAVNAEFIYGYEYLGNSGRLVITPLTDRCYLTLTGALHLKFGGAPAGPAGTGKTETTKDLAKAFAFQCVVFNCSDQLDYMAMGKFFKGLASSGAWACFDEFNRIDIEVLSVIAQQVITIQKAQVAKLERFIFEGVEIVLKASVAVFITMNPGYAGRTELPDNLKALFRPVAMMVPNYALIAEISLFSFGFSEAKELAGKIVTTFKLSSEQLSTQDHYDFGMRAVKTVIAVAGNLKQENQTMDERQICLRALREVNMPKFLTDDLKLFNGIVSDLFPRMIEQVVDYGILEESIRKTILEWNLEDVNEYVHKVIELYETTVVRHGLMLVGPTGSGKTKCYLILQEAMTALKGQLTPAGDPFVPVRAYILNPKSITMGQLYGEFDFLTHEWTDGILPALMRESVIDENEDKKWFIFDGPVDSIWIESMNTVLDDNKKLCLTSGEIIKMTPEMTMMFEVADLAVASPATVSRCGMIYLEPNVLGLQPFITCWGRRIPELAEYLRNDLLRVIGLYVLPAIKFLRSKLTEIVRSVDSSLVFSFFRMMDIRLGPLAGAGGKPPPHAEFLALMDGLVVPWVVFSVIWSIGATCDHQSRPLFSDWIRQRMKQNKHKMEFPRDGLVYDYTLHDGGFKDIVEDNEPHPPKWVHWMAKIPEYVINPDMKYLDIEVPTIDNVRSSFILDMLLQSDANVLAIGPTGTCKTSTIKSKLSSGMQKKFLCEFISFSARTSANQTQELFDSKLDKRRKNIFGPPLFKKMVFFIDDLNMPALEVFGAQPPIELIRQWMDFKGWYDLKSVGFFRNIVDVMFVCAMGPPGGGRNIVTMRLLRHFHYISFVLLDFSSKKTIFNQILNSWITRTPSLEEYCSDIVTQTIYVFDTILKELLPTPAKTHYTFNLRDLSKVFQGILMVEPKEVKSIDYLLRIWYHENCRIYQDRLINDEDRQWFSELLHEKIKNEYQLDPEEVLGEKTLLFGDFLNQNIEPRPYGQITDMEELTRMLNIYLVDYNRTYSTSQMRLVLFEDAISHVCRIARIIRQPQGNALLLGMGGSGRQSLTRLASHINEFLLFQIELSKSFGMSDWRDALKELMLRAGLKLIESVFLFSDNQIKTEAFLEDINNILNSGDVPNIYKPDELDNIYIGMRQTAQELSLVPTKSNLYSVFNKTVRTMLHTVITMSPLGEIFRARLRQFPALVNCCTIDWFCPWPKAALESVALQFLNDIPALEVNEKQMMSVVIMCQYIHQTVADASGRYLQELSRYNYVTPTSYLELLGTYQILLEQKKNELLNNSKRLSTGLNKLLTTSEEVKELQKVLVAMRPELEKAAVEAQIMLDQIAADTQISEDTKKVVEREEEVAQEMAKECEEIAADAQEDLDEAMPLLMAAEESLKSLNKNDISEVRSMKRPPEGVVYVIEAICIVKGLGTNTRGKVDYWELGRNMLSNSTAFLDSLVHYDKESLTEFTINKLKPYVENPAFQPKKIIKVSKACTSLCMWVHAIYKYYFVFKAVEPKRIALAEAKEKLENTQRILNQAKEEIRKLEEGLAILLDKLRITMIHKQDLEDKKDLCLARMDRAVQLVDGLADERVRWSEVVEGLHDELYTLIGDVLLSAGAVAYLTPFTATYRQDLMEKWTELLKSLQLPHSTHCSPVQTLGDPVLIRNWQVDGLPRDALSTENAILISNSRRWPLFIDPQCQANRWVKNMQKNNGLLITKLTEKDMIRSLESAIRFGKPCLIENVDEEMDPALDPILLKQIFVQSGQMVLKLGESVIPYNEDFKLYITTKLANPHYSPEISIKVSVVNFTVVPSGLSDQLLALVVMEERPELEEARSQIIVSCAQMRSEIKEIEDKILYKLSVSEGSPVDDIDLIETLKASKLKSEEILIKMAASEETQKDIDETRMLYVPVANRAQILYFCVADLANIDPMYQYSLEWFITIFIGTINIAEKTAHIDERVYNINESFTYSMFTNVCRSLFERHKLLFAFLLCVRIQMDQNLIDNDMWKYLISGGAPEHKLPNPAPSWISIKCWNEILGLGNLKQFEKFVFTFADYLPTYKIIFNSSRPHKEKFPLDFNLFEKILILKCLRPEKVKNSIQMYLKERLGLKFIEPQSSDLTFMFKESSATMPLLFVLSPGTDPAADLYKFADKMKMSKRLYVISLGQGQGPRAEAMFLQALEEGSWIFFQNCHLSPSWMPRLDRLIETINPEDAHKEFRIWLTSIPSPFFPVSILQNGSKMTVEPPRGIKANLLRAYINQVIDFYEFMESEHEKVPPFKCLLFSLCLFHGVILERRKFGPLGFNIPYEFTDGDLRICISQLHMFLLEYDVIPYKVLIYTAGQINYGGRVTDDWDRRCIMNILYDYYKSDVVNPNYVFYKNSMYHQMPSDTIFEDFMAYIKSLPINDQPNFFGLHDNANISHAQNEVYNLLSTLLGLQPKKVGGAAASQEDVQTSTAKRILATLPSLFDLEAISLKYPVLYRESLNTVLQQEIIRFNKLISVIETSLKDLLAALKGLVVMSAELEEMANSLYNNTLPNLWSAKAYPSLKPLASWVADLKDRINFLNNWVSNGIPTVFWISGFFFPQAFLTGTLQNFARKYIVSIDSINFNYSVLNKPPKDRPKDGACIYGLFLEGCRWDPNILALNESNAKELYTQMPIIWMVPEVNHVLAPTGIYECPVYKTLTRAGVLSTTGHSTNYVVTIEIPSYKPQSHWIKRGVALICALDY